MSAVGPTILLGPLTHLHPVGNKKRARPPSREARANPPVKTPRAAAATEVAGIPVIAARLDGLDPEGLRSVMDTLRDRLGSGVICLGSVVDGKVNLVAAVSKDLSGRFQAGKLVQEVAKVVGGGGGGRPDLAQAGGKDPAKLDEALATVSRWVERVAKG